MTDLPTLSYTFPIEILILLLYTKSLKKVSLSEGAKPSSIRHYQWRIENFRWGEGGHPEPEIRGMGALRASFWSKNKREPRPPWPIPWIHY